MAKNVLNPEGLTFGEWVGAAFIPPGHVTDAEERKYRKAWRAGEDPTEWRAHFAKENRHP